MGDETFNGTTLTEKLAKLNSSQQSIESLSRWCISHRKKAKQVVETWEKVFKSAQRVQQVSFLYLSNDILQNSRRKGSEFVNEFWKVLPSALKVVYEGGSESSRRAVTRLIEIWEERKVFGSRGQNLRNEILGKILTPNPIKVLKRDSTSLRLKLAVGDLPEKILTALQSVYDDIANEETALTKFHNAVSCVQEIEKDVVNASSQGNLHGTDISDDIQKQENVIQQCISELENSEAIRVALISQLREALQDQESKLEQIRNELLVARGQIEQAANIRLQLTSIPSAPPNPTQLITEPTFPPTLLTNSNMPPVHPSTSFANSGEEESKKAAAAAVAAKLAASTSSAQMLTSILSSLVAEEAASMSSGLKRQKLEPPFSDVKISESGFFPTSQQGMTNMPPVQSGTTQLQAPFLPPPPPPPPPLAPPANSSGNQLLVQSNMMGMPYGMTNLPSVLPSNTVFPRPPQQGQGQNQQAQSSGGYYRPMGIGFYGQSHQPPTPPIHRQ